MHAYVLSVQFSRSVVSDSLWPHESQHARPPCPSHTPGVHSDSHPLSPWCHPAISPSVVPFSSCPQSLPASESFPMSQLFGMRWPKYWSFSFSIIPSKEIPGLNSFRMDWLDLLAVQGPLKSLLQHHSFKSINSLYKTKEECLSAHIWQLASDLMTDQQNRQNSHFCQLLLFCFFNLKARWTLKEMILLGGESALI